ncbi:MAG: hypothetical protein GXO88_15310 [Chlorobi bacterium]|nr:hypothetical protein [Chlorobiota bacterium]
MDYRIWYSIESFANFIIANTELRNKTFVKKKMYESDANNIRNFHTMPDHIKKILYLDAPDLIVEIDHEPIFSVEVSTEAGTGHNVFQRFARLAASVENNVPSFYIYPEAVIITRQNTAPRWDRINPLIFKALDDVMSIYKIPSLFYYFPTDYKTHNDAFTSPNLIHKGLRFDPNRNYAGSPLGTDSEMTLMFAAMDEIVGVVERHGAIVGRDKLLSKRPIINRRAFMNQEFVSKGGTMDTSPLSAIEKIPTQYLLNYLIRFENSQYHIGELLRSRQETIIYKVDAKFRGDPYPGALAAIDYLKCREGKSFEERRYNLIMVWGNLTIDNTNRTLSISSTKSTINDFVKSVQASENKNILSKDYSQISNSEIPRYYMQVRYGSTYSKVKHIRVFSYFADAILFPDGSLWRDA